MFGCIDVWTLRCMDVCNVWMDGWPDGCMDGWMREWMDVWMYVMYVTQCNAMRCYVWYGMVRYGLVWYGMYLRSHVPGISGMFSEYSNHNMII